LILYKKDKLKTRFNKTNIEGHLIVIKHLGNVENKDIKVTEI